MFSRIFNRVLARCPGFHALLILSFAWFVPSANAQWSVVDREANGTLGEAKKKLDDIDRNLESTNEQLGSRAEGGGASINKNLDSLNKRLELGAPNAAASPGLRVEDPKQPWVMLSLDLGAEQCDQIAASQQAFCTELVRTRNAHYMYMKVMFDNSATRNQRLKDLVDARLSFQATDFGRLQDNTNQMIALQTLIALDQQQMESVNHAYRSRIDYLNRQITNEAHAATSGKSVNSGLDGMIGSIVSGIAGGAALKAALNLSRHASEPGQRTLSIER